MDIDENSRSFRSKDRRNRLKHNHWVPMRERAPPLKYQWKPHKSYDNLSETSSHNKQLKNIGESTTSLAKGPPPPKLPKVPRFRLKSTVEEANEKVIDRENGVSSLYGAAYIVNTSIAGSILISHKIFELAGLWIPLLMICVTVLIIFWASNMLMSATVKIHGLVKIDQLTYPEVVEASFAICRFKFLRHFAKCFRIFVEIIILIETIFSLKHYQVMSAEFLKQLLEGTNAVHYDFYPPVNNYVITLIMPNILMVMVTSFEKTGRFIIASVFAMVLVTVSAIYYLQFVTLESPMKFKFCKSMDALLVLVMALPIFLTPVISLHLIENNMRYPKDIFPSIRMGCLVVIVLFNICGFVNYWAYGDGSEKNILSNLPFEPYTSFLRVVLIFLSFSTFALRIFVLVSIFWPYLKKCHHPKNQWLTERFYRALLVLVIAFLSIFNSYYKNYLRYIKYWPPWLLTFVIPGFVDLCLRSIDNDFKVFKWPMMRTLIILMFGIFGVTVNWMTIFDSNKKKLKFIPDVNDTGHHHSTNHTHYRDHQ